MAPLEKRWRRAGDPYGACMGKMPVPYHSIIGPYVSPSPLVVLLKASNGFTKGHHPPS